ncbi:SRPBCC domain-containing protein [Geodermatophilus sp. URMC 62]|uniref:SRPBCC domain-containing protein n=1 Tax=Geodermatophilus sp. URMC 62 TaxID=3423414 RepID=UPI00406CC072
MTDRTTPADPPTHRSGVVTELPDGRRRLEFRRSWPDGPDDVWAALTEPDRLARWFGTYEGERTPGGRGTLTMTHEAEPAGEEVRIAECDPPRRLVVEWVDQADWRVELVLTVESGRTTLHVVQVFAAGTDVVDVALGWHWYLDMFDAEVGGRPAPADWDSFLAATGPDYGRAPEA